MKSCVGSTWCRYGVQDSVGFSIDIENRYKGLRAPHKLKFAVSGCTRECAEAQSKDVGIIATEKGWNLYVCGNGGMKPRHADLLAADLDSATLIRYVDRFLMFYIRTADRLQRTSVWLENLEGGLEYLKQVVIDDKLGIAAELEAEMAHIVNTYECEWKKAIERSRYAQALPPFRQQRARRRQRRLHRGTRSDSSRDARRTLAASARRPYEICEFVALRLRARRNTAGLRCRRTDRRQTDRDSSRRTMRPCARQLRSQQRSERARRADWSATCNGEPVVASPIYKHHFSLITGRCIEDAEQSVRVYPARVTDGRIWVKSEPLRAACPTRKLVVIGNGMAGMKVVEELLEIAPEAYRITVFGAEPHPNYNRILLSPVLAGEKRVEDIILNPLEWYREKGVTLHSERSGR